MKKGFISSAFAGAVFALAPNVHAGALYFEADGDNLVITAREADDSAHYWSMTVGRDGAITDFYDLTSDPGSDSSFNLARGNLLTTRISGAEARLDTHANATATRPEGTDGAASYTFSVSSTFADYLGLAMATFTSEITIHAPTEEGTRIDIVNTLTTPQDWASGSSLAQGGRESCSGLMLMIQNMDEGFLQSYNGWEEIPREAIQWAKFTAENSTGYAQGRSFYLAQAADLPVEAIGTNVNYQGVSMTENLAVLTQMLSGAFRGNAPADKVFTAQGALEINIAATP